MNGRCLLLRTSTSLGHAKYIFLASCTALEQVMGIVLISIAIKSSILCLRYSSGKGHKHPVYSMCLARRAASSTSTSSDWILITASTDGLLCHWDLENLNEPLSYTVINSCIIIPSIGLASFKSTIIEGNPKQAMVGTQGSERPISVSCMALGPEEEDRKVDT